jgi:heat shock protein HslJ
VVVFAVALWLAVVSEAGSPLENARWQLRDWLTESGEMTSIAEATTIDATFKEGQIRGTGGCNRYFAGYSEGEGQELTVSGIGSTRKACAPLAMEQEQRYLALLSQVTAWRSQGADLVLLDPDGRTLLAYVAAEPARLAGTSWQALAINNGRGGVVSTATSPLSELTFGADEAKGVAGCNRFVAAYEVEGDRIAIRDIESERRHCPEPDRIMEQESQFLQALRRARRWAVSSGRLEFRDEKGSMQVSFRPHDSQETRLR